MDNRYSDITEKKKKADRHRLEDKINIKMFTTFWGDAG